MQIASYYASLNIMGGGERQWAEELRAFRARGIDARGVVQEVSPRVVRDLGISIGPESVVLLPKDGMSTLRRIHAFRAWLRATRPSLLVAHTSPELIYLATRGTGVPYVLYQNDPPFLIGYPENPYPFAVRHRRAYRALRASTPGYEEFLFCPKLTASQRLRVEVRAAVKALAMRHAAAVVVLSQRAAAEVEALYGVQPTVIRGCLDEQLSPYTPRLDVRARHGLGPGPLLVSVCRLVEEKRVDVLLRAWPRVQERLPEARLLIGGSGPDEARLHRLAAELGLNARRVVFAGHLDRDELWDYVAAADLFVAPASADFNIAPYEALALGRKVLVSSELEVEDWLLESGWVRQAPPTAADFADGMLRGVVAPVSVPVDLSRLTWSARIEQLLACYGLAAPS